MANFREIASSCMFHRILNMEKFQNLFTPNYLIKIKMDRTKEALNEFSKQGHSSKE